MECLKCTYDLSEYEDYRFMYQHIYCPNCGNKMMIDYEEECTEDYSDCWDIWALIQIKDEDI